MPNPNVLNGAPTKRFFVSMLPRDIELDDAILDLVDNCIDGAMRQERGKLDTARPFEGYWCNLTVNQTEFVLEDNCGGIPDSYLDAAFRLGRPRTDLDSDLPTIGMYGIGMKRAIFKMAKDAMVVSQSTDRAVEVQYSAEWLDPDDENWELPLREIEKNGNLGVAIRITNLLPDVSNRFSKETFLDDLCDRLGQHFAYIMGKGFVIKLNGVQVRPETVRLIFSEDIKPFDYEANVDGVRIKVTVGFYRNLTRQAELEEATDPERSDPTARAAGEAGITVICNDRVIVMSDRSSVTGWGIASTPRYHPQFRAISGLISFFCDDAEFLPVSTTKRNLDTDSNTYRLARNAAMDGIKLFVGFTNRWKGSEEMVDNLLTSQKRVEAKSVSLVTDKGKTVRGSQHQEKKYVPDLPKPEGVTKKRRVAFSRDIDEIKYLASFLLGNIDAKAGDVGVAAWEETLKRSREQ